LEKISSNEDFWQDQESAQKTMQELELLRDEIKKLSESETEIDNLAEMTSLAAEDDGIKKEIKKQVENIQKIIENIEFETLFRGEYDRSSAILSIHSGTGGTDAQDWAEMLLKMYLRFAERKNWKAKIISESRGQEAGIKSATMEVIGKMAYGYLRAEAGVHRLVRLSPFNAKNLRQTSFALVEVLPEIDKIKEVEIDPGDLRIDTFRSGGAGGQSVNKTDSAVRITHIPTGLVAASQNERSQLQNKEQSMKILKAKLHQRYLEDKEKERQNIKGEHTEVQWGSQIRSYVLHPYKLVKDHRTKFESKNPEEVLDGNLEEFIGTYLKSK
jgi:peptide chain release factor 2